jgi:hypothetical protein
VLFLFFAYTVACQVAGLAQNGVFPAGKVRFTTVRTRSGVDYPNSTGISSFGMLMDGCPLPRIGEEIQGNGSLTIMGPSLANGYFIRVSDGYQGRLPAVWLVESFDNYTQSWKVVGSSVWRTDKQFQNKFYLLPGPDFDGEFRADYRLAWPWKLINMVPLGNGLGFLGCFLIGCLGKYYGVARHLWIFMAMNAGVVNLAVGLGRVSMGAERKAVAALLNVGVNFAFAISVIVDESRLVMHFLVLSGTNFIAGLVDESLHGFNFASLILRWLLDAGSILVAVSLYIIFRRFLILRKARALVRKDELAYRAAWAREMSREGFERALAKLMVLTQKLAAGCSVEIPRQRRISAEPFRDSPLVCMHFWRGLRIQPGDGLASGDRQHYPLTIPIQGLDQLYFQARCLHPILLEKVRHWARVSNGMIPVDKEGAALDFVRYNDVNPEDVTFIKWGQVKAVHRSIEKMVRSYSQASVFFHCFF